MSPSTAMPDSATKPTPAEMLKGMSRIHNATMPPMAANGNLVETRVETFSWPSE